MLPQEIRNREFTRSIRGYNTVEVDEYIDFLADAVALLQRENDELERKLTIAMGKLEELQEREASITRLDTEMRRAAARLLRQAENQRDNILADAHAKADEILREANAQTALQQKLCAAMQKEIRQFKEELYARYGQHIDQLEEIARAVDHMSFGDAPEAEPVSAVIAPIAESPAVEETPTVEEVEEFEEAPAAEDIEEFEEAPAVEDIEEFEEAPAVEDIEEFEEAPAVEEVEEFEEAPAVEEMEQLDLFDVEDDADAIHQEFVDILGGDALWTDYTDTIDEEKIDSGYTLILPENTESAAEELPTEDDEEEMPVAEPAEEPEADEDEDALLLKNLRRAFSVEFETFESKKNTQEPAAEEFNFVENEAPKKRGFLSRLIGGDSDN